MAGVLAEIRTENPPNTVADITVGLTCSVTSVTLSGDVKKLTSEVSHYILLFDFRVPHYSNQTAKQNVWNAIHQKQENAG
jgi:hypothetical protein